MKNKNIILIFILLLLDQGTKRFFYHKTILFKYFSFTYSENTGVAFSLFQNNNFLLTIITILILAFVIYLYVKEKENRLGLAFIIAGAIGNLTDRLIHGFVIDFINLRVWPTFNLADAFIIIGIIIILYVNLLKNRNLNKNNG